ncbi:hypothetical protein RFI_33035 [Reticulomyxa filosa]|uniref:Kelch motif family protein n=1 Tax=Reticulomyxa filosa TaxID=46433 RepID=X6LTE6_RETFI|nr:hypothetical protein RFI_33035 [Reticulomyxa filosa]|eukprot:ETO04362.1 hypothetical protein RFI_33035 [Reticulomyxa filosa]
MGNQSTAQKPSKRQAKQKQNLITSTSVQGLKDSSTSFAKRERKPEQSQDITTSAPFETLKDLPTPLWISQCVLHKHEILICGGYKQSDCYSYHTIKIKYKFICSYPSNVYLAGHCVVKLKDHNSKDGNEITLLSFGGNKDTQHTLVMKYVSVWSNGNKIKKSSNDNKWVPFTNNHYHPIHIGRGDGSRAVISGSNNHLLFITYPRDNISVFDLNTFQFIKHDTLPTDDFIGYHCFGLLIEYDEDNNTFQFHQLLVCDDIASFYQYAYVCINDVILFFGGFGYKDGKYVVSKSLHKYSIRENKWITFQNTLPSPLYTCVAVLSEDNTLVHIIGGMNTKQAFVSTHMKTKVSEWLSEEEMKKGVQLKVEKEEKENGNETDKIVKKRYTS